MWVEGLASRQKVDDGEESVIICSTFGREESAYQRELLTVNKGIDCEELVK